MIAYLVAFALALGAWAWFVRERRKPTWGRVHREPPLVRLGRLLTRAYARQFGSALVAARELSDAMRKVGLAAAAVATSPAMQAFVRAARDVQEAEVRRRATAQVNGGGAVSRAPDA
jgi:hypothetical protein